MAVGQGLGAKARGPFKNALTGRRCHSASCTLYNMEPIFIRVLLDG